MCLARLRKKADTNINIRNERGEIITDPINIKA